MRVVLLCTLSFALFGCYGDRYVGISGAVRDTDASPIPGAKVSLRLEDGEGQSDAFTTATNETGEFSVNLSSAPSLKRASATLEVTKDGFVPYRERIDSSAGFVTRTVVLRMDDSERDPP